MAVCVEAADVISASGALIPSVMGASGAQGLQQTSELLQQNGLKVARELLKPNGTGRK